MPHPKPFTEDAQWGVLCLRSYVSQLKLLLVCVFDGDYSRGSVPQSIFFCRVWKKVLPSCFTTRMVCAAFCMVSVVAAGRL